MGSAIMQEIASRPNLHLTGVCVRQDSLESARSRLSAAGMNGEVQLASNPADILERCDVAIDFSLPEATAAVVAAIAAAGKPLVCGVTGLNDATLTAIRQASTRVPLLYDRNMSIGIAVMEQLIRKAASTLGAEFAASVSETHHVHKADAPSGTALKLGEALAQSRGQDFRSVYRFDPDGFLTEAPEGEIVITAIRQGENPGEHTVRFVNADESLELTHKVTSRRVFASGAVAAATWLVGKPNGLYSVGDIAA